MKGCRGMIRVIYGRREQVIPPVLPVILECAMRVVRLWGKRGGGSPGRCSLYGAPAQSAPVVSNDRVNLTRLIVRTGGKHRFNRAPDCAHTEITVPRLPHTRLLALDINRPDTPMIVTLLAESLLLAGRIGARGGGWLNRCSRDQVAADLPLILLELFEFRQRRF